MTQENDSELVRGSQEQFAHYLKEQLRMAVRATLVTILEEEVQAFIGAKPYERSEQRRDQRNGHYHRDLDTTMGHIEELPVPRTRHGHQTQLEEQAALKGAGESYRRFCVPSSADVQLLERYLIQTSNRRRLMPLLTCCDTERVCRHSPLLGIDIHNELLEFPVRK